MEWQTERGPPPRFRCRHGDLDVVVLLVEGGWTWRATRDGVVVAEAGAPMQHYAEALVEAEEWLSDVG